MEIIGKIIRINPPIVGEGQNGTWKKEEFVIETVGEYPKKVLLINWNDSVKLSDYKVGSLIEASVDIQSREYNNRWYTDIKVWKIQNPISIVSKASNDGTVIQSESSEVPETDLPF